MMSVITAKFAPPKSVVAVMDPKVGVPRQFSTGKNISVTDSCVALGTLMELDGETEFTIGSKSEIVPIGKIVFQGRVKTPNRLIAICDIFRNPIVETKVNGYDTSVEIWTNDDVEPDKVFVIAD